jgi:hypothetical protein
VIELTRFLKPTRFLNDSSLSILLGGSFLCCQINPSSR